MNTAENQNDNTLLAGGEPHQREEMQQAEAASRASFNLEPEKGITPDPAVYNKEADQQNIKQPNAADAQDTTSPGFDPVSELDLDTDENSITPDDLQALNGLDQDEESTM
jgi:hypothetical protein